MEKLPLLDVVVGLTLIYTFLSLLSSELTEFIVTVLHWRTQSLKRGIMTLLGESLELGDDPKLKDTITGRVLRNSRMSAIAQHYNQRHVPATLPYIPAQLFAEALLDVLQSLSHTSKPTEQKAVSEITLVELLSIVESSPEVSLQLKANLKRLIKRTQIAEPDPKQQMTQLKHEIALWFKRGMNGAFTVYKHNLKAFSFFVSLVLAITINADSLYVIRRVSENTATRTIVVQNAPRIQGCRENLNSPRCVERTSWLMESTTIPIGWHRVNRQQQFAQLSRSNILRAIGGWLLTGIAISMGSQFWFQLLNRIVDFHGREIKPRPFTRSSKHSF